MHAPFKLTPMLIAALMCASQAQAASNDTPASSGSEPGVVVKVERAVERGAKAAASGVEHGARAAAGGIKRGAQAAASGVERGTKAAAHGVEKGAKATANAASHVANKIGGSGSSAPAHDNASD